MPWERTDMGEQRVKLVVRAASGKERMSALCQEFGVSRPTGYRWWRRFQQAGSVTAIVERSRRPEHSPAQTETRKEERVVALRQEHGWGAKKLEVLLREEGQPLTVITINRILKRHVLVRKKDSHAPAMQRFERGRPNELWQMDGKGAYGGSDGMCYPLSILDDHSRYVVGLYGLRAFTAEEIYPCMVRTFERYGVPEAMLMDRGSVWWGTKNGYGLTWLSVRMIEQGIGLHYGRVHHPQTQGKVERFHRTLDEALRYHGKPSQLAQWPEALGMKRPMERYRVSARSYQAQPKQWEYPAGSVVRKLNAKGVLDWEGQQWFVCEALAGRQVRVEKIGELLLVSFRHMYVREIDRRQRCTRALVLPRGVGRSFRSPSGLPASPANVPNEECGV